jgi:transcriptional regulator with XRE-family HTH domain
MTDEALKRQLGKRISQLRLVRGLKQEDMCRFGFEYKYYQRIEYGEKNLTLKTLNKLANSFGVDVSELFRFDAK